MNKLSKKTKKGFTLVELVIVMAVFGLLMVAVISIANPVSKIFKKAEFAEKSYSDSNNISLYIQNQLQYADNLVIYTEDIENDVDNMVKKFAEDYYEGIVTKNVLSPSNDISATKYVDGNIYVLRLSNKDTDEDDSEGNKVQRGQIYLSKYPFTSYDAAEEGVKIDTDAAEMLIPQLSSAYFNASNKKNVFSYALGAQKLVSVDNYIPNSKEKLNAFADDVANLSLLPKPNYQNLTVSIVASAALNAAEKDVIENGLTENPDDNPYKDFTVFKGPASISVANVPLLNMSFRNVSDQYEKENDASRRVSMVKRYQMCENQVEYELEYQTNPDGSFKLDMYGDKIPCYETDADGNIIYDESGNKTPVYKRDPSTGNLIPVYEYEADGVTKKTEQVTHEDGTVTTEYVLKKRTTIERQLKYNAAFNAYSIYDSVNASKDIYFVFAYADELH